MTDRRHWVREYAEVSLGVVIVSLGFYFLLKPSNLVTGGVTGLSLIFEELLIKNNVSLETVSLFGGIFILISNILLLIIGRLTIGKDFFYKTIYGTILLPLVTIILSLFKIPDTLIMDRLTDGATSIIIASVLGGVMTGVGLGLVFKNNATTGGADVLQRLLHDKLKIPYSLAIYLVDGAIIGAGVFFFGIELAFFAIIAIVIAGISVDKVILTGRSGYTVFIVTNDYKVLKQKIYEKINRGVTKVDVIGGYSEQEKEMLVCTITKNQLYHIKSIILEHDPEAFTFITKTMESVGQGFR